MMKNSDIESMNQPRNSDFLEYSLKKPLIQINYMPQSSWKMKDLPAALPAGMIICESCFISRS